MSLIACMLLVSLGQFRITDPITDFIEFNPQFDGFQHEFTELEVLRMDMDGDGADEVFIRSKDGYRDRQGTSWVVYTPSTEGYVRVPGFAHFFATQAYVGAFEIAGEDSGFVSDKGRGIITFGTMGSGKGTLVGIQLKDGKLKLSRLREIDAKFQDKELYQSLFQEKNGSVPEIIGSERIEEIRASLAQFSSPIDPKREAEDDSRDILSEPEQETRPPADAPTTELEMPDEAEGPDIADTEATLSEDPEGSGRPVGILLVTMGAVAFLLAFAGIRAFRKAPSDS